MTTNTDRIIQVLRERPGVDDDELARCANVHPRQQVNQICRRLEQQGVLKRVVGSNGKIGNILVGSQAPTSLTSQSQSFRPERFTSSEASSFASAGTDNLKTVPTATRVWRNFVQHAQALASKIADKLVDTSRHTAGMVHARNQAERDRIAAGIKHDVSSALFIIPCSSAKVRPLAAQETGPSLLKILPPDLAQRLKHARDAMRVPAHVDETTLLPAWMRYSGTLYQSAVRALADAADLRLNVVIVSGGYGLVLADEPIGYYDAIFRLSSWPRGLLEEVLIEYAHSRKIRNVCAIASSTGDYRRLLARVRWGAAGVTDAVLLSPRAGAGAMVLSPRAQGEALTALLRGSMDASWSSSDGLRLHVQRLV